MKKLFTATICLALILFSVSSIFAQSPVRNVFVVGSSFDVFPKGEVNFQMRTVLDNEVAFVAAQDNVRIIYDIVKDGKSIRSSSLIIKKAGNTAKIAVPLSFNKDTTCTLKVWFLTENSVQEPQYTYITI